MKKFFLNSIILLGICSACTSGNKSGNQETDPSSLITIDHLSGSTAVKKHPENVVILQYGMLDTYEQLGLKQFVKGIPKLEIPHYLSQYENDDSLVDLGTTMEANMEKVNELNPDLIIIGSRMGPKYEQFSKIAPTINLEPDQANYWKSFCNNHRAITRLYGQEQEMEKKLSYLENRINKIKRRAEKSDKRALITLTNEGRISIYGKGSRFGLIHDVFGLKAVDQHIEVSSHGQSVTNEYIKEVNPDIIFVIDRGAALKREKATIEQFTNPLIMQTEAFKNKKIIFLDPDLWYLSGGGLKSFDLMINEIEKII